MHGIRPVSQHRLYLHNLTVNFLNIRTPKKIVVITLKVEQDGISFRIIHPKDAGGIVKSVDPDQTAPLGAVWPGSALFAQACVSEHLGPLRYIRFTKFIGETGVKISEGYKL